MKQLKRLLARVIFWFLGRGMCACAAADSRVRAEVESWDEGARVQMQIYPAGPAMAIEKRGGTLRFLGTRTVPDPTLAITFKQIDTALPVLLGMTSVADGYAQRRMTLKGDPSFAVSVVRVMLLVEAYLFPALITRRIMQRVPKREVSMFRIYLSTLLAANGR